MEEDLYCELHCGSALHSPICLPDMAVVAVGRGPTTEVISRKCSRRQVYTTFDCCLHTNIGSNNGVELVSLPREGLASETSVECTQCHLGSTSIHTSHPQLTGHRQQETNLPYLRSSLKPGLRNSLAWECTIHMHNYSCSRVGQGVQRSHPLLINTERVWSGHQQLVLEELNSGSHWRIITYCT